MSAITPMPADARMDAYYFGFERTEVGAVDALLSAVAWAGKGAHNTESWNDTDISGYYRGRSGLPDGESGTDLIQQTANRSAAQVKEMAARLKVANQRLRRVEDFVAMVMDTYGEETHIHDDGGGQPDCIACWVQTMEHVYQILRRDDA